MAVMIASLNKAGLDILQLVSKLLSGWSYWWWTFVFAWVDCGGSRRYVMVLMVYREEEKGGKHRERARTLRKLPACELGDD